jgi:hypothetical protein
LLIRVLENGNNKWLLQFNKQLIQALLNFGWIEPMS